MAKDIHPVDVFVGQRLRQRRISLGITQEDTEMLADIVRRRRANRATDD